jgi:hypothetical protein
MSNVWSSFDQRARSAVIFLRKMKRMHSIRVPVTLTEQRDAQRLAERLDVSLAQLVRKMLRDASEGRRPAKRGAPRPG